MNPFKLVVSLSFLSATLFAATNSLICTTTAVPNMVRSEGLAEPLGDILMSCTGGAANATVTGVLTVSVPLNVTNRIGVSNVINATLTADIGAGAVSTGATPILGAPYTVSFTGATFLLSSSGTAYLRIAGLRAAIGYPGGGQSGNVVATLHWESPDTQIYFDRPTVVVAVPRTTLYASSATTFVNCYGSTLPAQISVANLYAQGTAMSATRITEGFPNAFGAWTTGLDAGVRIILRYKGFPTNARLFVPDAIAGSNAFEPTKTGLMGGYFHAGQHTPGSSTLLLARVLNPDADGAGGTMAYLPVNTGGVPVVLNGATEVKLTNGEGIAVFQVMDADPLREEVAEIPTWLGLPKTGGTRAAPEQTVLLGPVSSVNTASATAPILRFLEVEPASDCTLNGDCDSFPQMKVTAPKLEFTAEAGSMARPGLWVEVDNPGGGLLSWTAYLAYANGSGWGSLAFTTSALKNGSGYVRLVVSPAKLKAGIYEGTLTVDGGSLGVQNFPVKFTVTAPDQPPAPAPQVAAVVHAATFASGAVVAGSLASVMGTNLGGTNVTVAFDGVTAPLLYKGATQINLQVPASLAGKASTQMIVTVDGVSSQSITVPLATVAPGVFGNGVLNQDNTVNNTQHPAAGGSVIQVFLTGLPETGAQVTAKIHDVWIDVPEYAGPAPGLTGVQQVNLRVPSGWPTMDTTLIICGTTGAGRTCSPQAPFSVKK